MAGLSFAVRSTGCNRAAPRLPAGGRSQPRQGGRSVPVSDRLRLPQLSASFLAFLRRWLPPAAANRAVRSQRPPRAQRRHRAYSLVFTRIEASVDEAESGIGCRAEAASARARRIGFTSHQIYFAAVARIDGEASFRALAATGREYQARLAAKGWRRGLAEGQHRLISCDFGARLRVGWTALAASAVPPVYSVRS